MQWLIPYASTLSEAGTHALRDLALPNLGRLLSTATVAERWGDDEYSLTPPHERAHAAALGWRGDDGALPWAALHAALDGIAIGEHAWGELTPVHRHVRRDHVSLADPTALALAADGSQRLLDAVRALLLTRGGVVPLWSPPR